MAQKQGRELGLQFHTCILADDTSWAQKFLDVIVFSFLFPLFQVFLWKKDLFVTIRSLNGNISSPFPGPHLDGFTVPSLWTLPSSCQFCLGEVVFPSVYLTKVSRDRIMMYARLYVSLLSVTYLLFPKIFLMCSVISLLVLSSTSTKTCSPLSVKKDL